jgi:hypothetical protein
MLNLPKHGRERVHLPKLVIGVSLNAGFIARRDSKGINREGTGRKPLGAEGVTIQRGKIIRPALAGDS